MAEYTPVDLDPIRKRVEAATDGPWRVVYDSCDCGGEYGCSHGEFPYALRLPAHRAGDVDRPCDPSDSLDQFRHTASDISDFTAESIEFIAAARTDVPALVAEVERLRADVEAASRSLLVTRREANTVFEELRAERDEARAALQRVREVAGAWVKSGATNGAGILAEQILVALDGTDTTDQEPAE